MHPFTFATAPRILFGEGRLAQSGAELVELLGAEILLVSDSGMVELGFVSDCVALLEGAGARVRVFAEVQADPPEAIVNTCAQAAHGCSGVLGLGGGSSLDTAKLAAVLANNENQPLAEMYGIGNVAGTRLPLALVPTTAGTGSEVTPISIVTTAAHEKMGVVAPQLLPDLALLDPTLTFGLPPAVTAATGIDAMVHAIEAYTTANPNANPISQSLAREALRLMGPALERAVNTPQDAQARKAMLLGSMLAGQAFANAPVAAVHALAYPLGGQFGLAHGLSNALVLPHVLRFNAPNAAAQYATLAGDLFPEQPGANLPDALAALSARCGLPQRLRDLDIPQSAIPALAVDAMNQTRLLINNPRPVTRADAEAIYEAAW